LHCITQINIYNIFVLYKHDVLNKIVFSCLRFVECSNLHVLVKILF
jgi:hypothetical protein